MQSIIRQLRRNLGIRQYQLADRLQISRQTLNKYEQDSETIPLKVVKQVASILGVDYISIIENKMPWEINSSNLSSTSLSDNYVVEGAVVPPLSAFPRSNPDDRFQQIFLHLLVRCGCRPNIYLSSICKILYLLSYDYYKKTFTSLLYNNFIKEVLGPVPYTFSSLITNMEKTNKIEIYSSNAFNNQKTKFIPLVIPSLDTISAEDLTFLNKEIDKYSCYSPKELDDILQTNEPYLKTELNSVIDFFV